MKLTFFGAAGDVTGSSTRLEIAGYTFLIDCGMFQGGEFNEIKNHDDFAYDPLKIDGLLVTHAHLDHTGLIPKLVRAGFHAPIYSTKATGEFMPLIWEDAHGIMVYNNRKHQSPILFDESDIITASALIDGFDYGEWFEPKPGVKVRFHDAGHIFGASFIEISALGQTVVFSGDLGNSNAPILRDTDSLPSTHVLVVESTYGGRQHESRRESRKFLHEAIMSIYKSGGTLMIPAFSLERTQELLYDLNEMVEHEKIVPPIRFFLDSPLAIKALPTYRKYQEYYDTEAARLARSGDDFFHFPGLEITATKDQSLAINDVKGPKVVIAGSGMMNGGRIIHHALRYLSDPNSILLLVGYQANGTLGRKLLNGATKVRIFNTEVDVRCQVKAVGGLSAHADQEKIISWVRSAPEKPARVFCNHGEQAQAEKLAHRLKDEFGLDAEVPVLREVYEI